MLLVIQEEAVETRPRRAFVSYSHTQPEWRNRVVDALSGPNGHSQIAAWHDGKLLPGQRWDDEIKAELDRADIVLLLVSPAFLTSEYCRDIELDRAIKRADVGETLLIPIVLESCDWSKEPFARYQALPLNGTPLQESQNIKATLDDCRDKLDLACLGQWYPRRPRPGTGEQGVWRLKLRAPSKGAIDWKSIVHAIRDLVGDPDVEFLGVQRPSAGQPAGTGIKTAIYDGPAMAFVKLEREDIEGRLSSILGVEVVGIELIPGALIHAGTSTVDWSTKIVEHSLQLLTCTPAFEPPRLFGLAVRPSEPDYLLPLNSKAGLPIGDEQWQLEKKKFLGYFFTALALPGEDMHVNLSAYERSRIMPRTLSQTPLGQVIAEQDCLLKHFVSSLLHPDSPTGQEFWPRIRKASEQFGDGRPVDLWQKVWIIAGSATVQQKDAGQHYAHSLPPGFEIRDSDWLGWIAECRMKVMCETDYVALQHNTAGSTGSDSLPRAVNEQFLDIFREIVLPTLETEVNDGSHFAPLRQVFHGVTLAKWYREVLSDRGIHTRLTEIAGQMRQELAGPDGTSAPSPEIGVDGDAPDWLKQCFESYMDLLDGVFRCVRVDGGDSNTLPVRRLYYSGGVTLIGDRIA